MEKTKEENHELRNKLDNRNKQQESQKEQALKVFKEFSRAAEKKAKDKETQIKKVYYNRCNECKIDEVKESMVYGNKPDQNSKKEEKELIITARVLPDYDKIKELHGDISNEEIYKILWNKIKEVNKQLTSYKAVKALEIKEGEFEKTSTMKIKRYKELSNKTSKD